MTYSRAQAPRNVPLLIVATSSIAAPKCNVIYGDLLASKRQNYSLFPYNYRYVILCSPIAHRAITNYLHIITYFVSENKPLEAARKAQNSRYVHIISNFVLLTHFIR